MSDTLAAPSSRPRSRISAGDLAARGVALDAVRDSAARADLLRGRRRGRRLAGAGPLRARVGARRAPPPRLPLPLRQRTCFATCCICGLLAGLCGGLLATGFARVVGETPDRPGDRVRGLSTRPKAAARARGGPVVSRTLQKSVGLLTAAVVYGLALGGLFALAFAAVYGRVGRASPARTSILLAAVAFVVLYLVPFVKYPANPPSVGDPDTITQAHGPLPDHDPDLAAGRDRRGAPAERAGRALVGHDGDAASPAPATCSSSSLPAHCYRRSTRCRRRSRRSRCSASARPRSACSSWSGRRSASCSPRRRSAS